MGKFDGILLCTDLDDTLLEKDKSVSDENIRAIEYFKSEGGMFTFATGRVPLGTKPVLEYVTPNAPMVCFNGGVVYDIGKKKMLWSRALDSGAAEVLEFVDKRFPTAGIEVCTADKVYFCKENAITDAHKRTERFPDNSADYNSIEEKWNKVIFMVTEEEMPDLRSLIDNSEYGEKYSYVRSSPWYYELLPKGAGKGEGLKKLAGILGVDIKNVIAVGDNENDLSMIKAAGVGIAVENAAQCVKEIADYITVSHDRAAIAAVIQGIEDGIYKKY